MAKKAKNSVLKYTRVKPFTNVLISCLFIFLALICLLPALIALPFWIRNGRPKTRCLGRNKKILQQRRN